MQDDFNINREHKDRLFRKVFSSKKDLLSLYNAINDSDYDNPEELQIYTMESFVYMGMKNDLSFLLDMTLNVFEHQSTYNPNMPLRGFFYMSAALQKYVALHDLDLYSSARILIPIPLYYVFYNGTDKIPDESDLHLTDNMELSNARERSCVQFTAHMVNINAGHSNRIMSKCPQLYEYALFIQEIRDNQKKKLPLKEAVEMAVDTCIEKGILKDILLGNKAEVTRMILEEYDESKHIANEKRLSFQEGVQQGIQQGIQQERVKTQMEKQRADDADKQASEANKRFEEADRREKLAVQKSEILMMLLQKKSKDEITQKLKLPLEEIQKILAEIQ